MTGMSLMDFKGRRSEMATAQGEAEQKLSEVFNEYQSLLQEHSEHLALAQDKEAEKIKPAIVKLRGELEELEQICSDNSDEVLQKLAREALDDGLVRLKQYLKRHLKLLNDLKKAEENYLNLVSDLSANQRQALQTAGVMSKTNSSLPEEDRVDIPGWRSPLAWDLVIDEEKINNVLSRSFGIWPSR